MQLVLRRLFLPLLIIWTAAIGGVGYFMIQTLVDQQQLVVRSMVQMIDRHLDQGGRILDAVGRVAEITPVEDMNKFMQGTWEAYRHFDTIYYLDENSKIVLMVPSDPMYLGLDMSNLPKLQYNAVESITISRPFISLRTGAPTVYLIKSLSHGGCVVGELSLGTFENEIVRYRDTSAEDSILILDQSGTLLAYSASDLVKQQTNMSYLEIFQKGLSGDATLVYDYEGTVFLGNTTQVPRVGWVIIDQIPLVILLEPYMMTFGITILVMLVIWLALVWNLRKQLERNVVAPLVQLSQSTDALVMEDYSKVSTLAAMPTAFIEVDRLVNDFQRMSTILQIRQTAQRQAEEALKQAYDDLEIKVQERTTALAEANQFLYSEIGERKNAEELLGQKNQELEKAYVKLKNAQSQVIQQEKLAGIGQLAAGVAHEINNPLGFVSSNIGSLSRYFQTMRELIHQYQSFMGMIKKQEADVEVTIADIEQFEKKKKIGIMLSDITDLINESQDGLERISKIVVSLRTFSRIDMGNQFAEFDLNKELQNVLLLARNEIKYHADVQQELTEISSIQAIGGYINQVLLNIIVNAAQAIKVKNMQRMGLITIRTWQEDNYVFCSVSDNGIGIKEEYRSRIFDAFFTTKPVGDGTGLGLSISYDIIVNKHGGKLLVESEEGLGTTLTIKLPVQNTSS